MAFVEDFTAYFADFGVDATLGGEEVRGIFDEKYADAFGMVSGNQPVLIVESSVSVDAGNSVTIGARSFVVTNVEPDGTGLTVLRLESA